MLYPGVASPLREPGDVDFVVVREGTEGPYVGNGGAIRVGTPHEIANEVSVNTAYGVERVVRFAFELARSAPRRSSPSCTRPTCSSSPASLWKRTVDAVAAEFPDVAVDYLHVDAATIFLVTDPARFDVIVTDNLFGDILTDLAGAISGGIGLAASGNINPDGAFPSMFEPVHGSAPDIAGQADGRPRPPRSSPSPCCSTTSGSATRRRASTRRRHRRPRRPHRRRAPHDRRDRRRDRRAARGTVARSTSTQTRQQDTS